MAVSDRAKVSRSHVLFRIARKLSTMPACARTSAIAAQPGRFILTGITRPMRVAAIVQAYAVRRGVRAVYGG
jgi:hypothetical protein